MRLLSNLRNLTLLDRFCYGVLAAATLFMLAVGCWEIAAPFGAGHVAVLPARAMMADNMVRFGLLFPVRAYTAKAPDISQAYAHHPWGTYYLFALTRLLFGRHEWAVRLVPVCVSVGMPSLLFFVARRLWGKIAGALAALGWVVLPITLAFAQFPSFEMFSIAGMLGVMLTGLRYDESPTRGRLLALLGATFLCANTDWTGSLFVGLSSVTALFVMAFAPARRTASSDFRKQLQGILGVLSVTVLTVLLYAALFQRVGLLEDFTGSAVARARGNELPFSQVLAHRRYWIEVMFTKPGIALGVLGAWVMLVRVLVLRRFSELLPLLLLGVSVFHYVYFKNGADVHIYWPLPFAAQFALSLGVLAVSIPQLCAYVIKKTRPQGSARVSVGESARSSDSSEATPQGLLTPGHRLTQVSVGVVAAVGLLAFPDALRALDYARDTGCRLNDDGQLNLQDYDKNLALASFKSAIKPDKRVLLDGSLMANWSQDYALERETVVSGSQAALLAFGIENAIYDIRFASPNIITFLRNARHRLIGPYLWVNALGEGGIGAVEGFAERKPGLFARYWVQSHDPFYSVVADPYRTWEWREHLGYKPNPIPPELDLPVQRVDAHRANVHNMDVHNMAVAVRQSERASEMLQAIEQGLDRRSARRFEDGTRVLGHRLLEGTPPRLEVYFLAATTYGNGASFDVRSRVTAAQALSFVVADDKEKKYGVGFELPPSLWKTGFVYVSRVEVRERPGHERFYGLWQAKLGPRNAGARTVTIPLFERP